MLIIVSGYKSVGKTTIGKNIAKACGGIFINGPETFEPLIANILEEKGLTGHSFQNYVERSLAIEENMNYMRQLIADNIALDMNVVVELSVEYSDIHLAEKGAFPIHYVEVTLPLALEKAQLMAHAPQAFQQIEDWDTYVATRFPVYADGELFERDVVQTFANEEPLTTQRLVHFIEKLQQK